MKDPRFASRRRIRPVLALALIVLGLPACNGTRPWSRGQVPAQRMAYKPVPTSLRGRTYYVSGYGGADYSPNRPHKRTANAVPVYPAPGSVYGAPAPSAVDSPPQVSIRQGVWDEP